MEEITLPPKAQTQTQPQPVVGFEPTQVRQFTVFLENRVGRLQQLVRAFEENAARIVAIAIEESAEATLVRLVCSKPDLGRVLLKEHGFAFAESDVLAVELPERTTQPLISICSALLTAEINIHYAYPLLLNPRVPSLVLNVDEPTLAAQILIRKGFTLIGESDLKD